MKPLFNVGDIKVYEKIVSRADIAAFDKGTVHEFYSTFSLARDAEWSTRLFVLEMKEEDEEGIGTFINIRHVSPAKPGDKITFYAKLDSIVGHEVVCSFDAKVNNRIIADGMTGQKILKKHKLEKIIQELVNDDLFTFNS